jgi:tetratricopeptide (TPR) repeat protein
MNVSCSQRTLCGLLAVWSVTLAAGCSLFRKDPHPPLPKLDPALWAKLHPEQAQAVEQAYDAARNSPGEAEVVSRLAMTLHAMGLEPAARQVYARAISLRPKNGQLAYLYAHLLSTGQGFQASGDEQVEAWERATALNPDYLPARMALLQVLLARNRLGRARAVADELLKTRSPEPMSYYWAGRVRREQQDFPAAIQFFLTACDLDPGLRPARLALAEAHRAAGEQEKAAVHEQLAGPDPAAGGSRPAIGIGMAGQSAGSAANTGVVVADHAMAAPDPRSGGPPDAAPDRGNEPGKAASGSGGAIPPSSASHSSGAGSASGAGSGTAGPPAGIARSLEARATPVGDGRDGGPVTLDLAGIADPILDRLMQLRGPIAAEMENARRARRAGRPQEAIRSYLAVLHRDSRHAEAYAGLMELAFETRQFAAMKEYYQKATQAGIDLPSIQFAWAQALLAQNHAAEAEKLLRTAAERDPRNPVIQAQLAATLDRMQQRADAEASYRRVLELNPADRDARAGLARLVVGKNPAEAAALFERSLGGPDPKENAIRLYQLADAYFRLRKWDLVVARAKQGRQLAQAAKIPWLVARLESLIARAQAAGS